jgi:hypothetical protein
MGERESDSKFVTPPAIIMDNAHYCRKQRDIKLNKSSLKKDMLEYLQCCGVTCEDGMKKFKLFSLAKNIHSKAKVYQIDTVT